MEEKNKHFVFEKLDPNTVSDYHIHCGPKHHDEINKALDSMLSAEIIPKKEQRTIKRIGIVGHGHSESARAVLHAYKKDNGFDVLHNEIGIDIKTTGHIREFKNYFHDMPLLTPFVKDEVSKYNHHKEQQTRNKNRKERKRKNRHKKRRA